MEKSVLVENLGQKYKDNPIKVYDETGLRKTGQPDEGQVNKAFLKICEIWNRDEASRKFLKHLIDAFIPLQPLLQITSFGEDDTKNNKNRCCILGIKLAGLDDITTALTTYGLERLRMSGQAIQEKRKNLGKEEMKKLKEIRDSFPVEVRTATSAYSSTRSDKYLSCHAAYALNVFVEECLLGKEKEVKDVLNKKIKRIEWKAKEERKKANEQKPFKLGNYGLGNFLSEEDMKKLKGIK